MTLATPIPHTRAAFTRADEEAVLVCIKSGMVAHGSRVRAFEEQLAARTGARGAITTSSGTAALVLALRTVGVGPGDEVVVPTYVCRAVYESVRAVGGTPVLVDNDASRCISIETVAPVLTAATKAIVVVDTLGHPAPVHGLLGTGIPVIEDACQGLGGIHEGRALGLRGTLGVVSFHGTKLVPVGDGGAVLCTQGSLEARVRELRDGEGAALGARAGDHLSDLSASLASAVLARLDETIQRRRAITDRYRRRLVGTSSRIILPDESVVPYRFPLRVRGAKANDFDRWSAQFLELGVSVRRGVDAMNHLLFPGHPDRAFPVAETDYLETLSIPLYESLTETEVERIEGALDTVFGPMKGSGAG